MKFLRFSVFLIGLGFKLSSGASSKMDSGSVANNWYIPSTTSALVRSDSSGDTSYYNYNTIGSQQPSSLMPTSQVGTQTSYIQPNYQYSEYQTKNKVYSPSAYTPEGNPLQIFSTGVAEQRQEIFDPNLTPDDDGESVFDGLPFGGVANTASSIASGIGLGGLGIAGSIIVLLIGLPLLAFAVLFPVAILIVAILGFPVLRLTLPPSDPNLARKFKTSVKDVAGRAMEVLQSEECIERVSCVLATKARKLPYEDWILEKMNETGRPWTSRLSKSVKEGRTGGNCDNFNCSPLKKLSELYKAINGTTTTKV